MMNDLENRHLSTWTKYFHTFVFFITRSSLKSFVCEVDSFREITTGDDECTACPIGSSTEW